MLNNIKNFLEQLNDQNDHAGHMIVVATGTPLITKHS
jgi:hypothetical protein